LAYSQLASKRLSRVVYSTPSSSLPKTICAMGRPQPEPESDKPSAPPRRGRAQGVRELPNVLEVYPQIRFLHRSPLQQQALPPPSSPHARLLPQFRLVRRHAGQFFSSITANEAILQIDSRKIFRISQPRSSARIGLRYAERQSLPSAGATTDASGILLISRRGFPSSPKNPPENCRVVETEPAAGYGGFGNARLLIPLGPLPTLRAAQVNDLRACPRLWSNKNYLRLALRSREISLPRSTRLESSIKKMGFRAFSLLDAF